MKVLYTTNNKPLHSKAYAKNLPFWSMLAVQIAMKMNNLHGLPLRQLSNILADLIKKLCTSSIQYQYI